MTWRVEGLTVRFGATTALDHVDLAAEPGRVAAVVGGDGAGKTTLLRVLAGLPAPTEGRMSIPDADRIGYVPASGGVFNDLTVAENLEFVADGYGVGDAARRAAPLLSRTGLEPFTQRLAGDLSGGMRRKLAVIGALVHRPDLLVLDEPTTGIDPVSRSDLWRLIAAAATRGAAIVVSSAYLDEAERAESVLVLHDGREVISGDPEEVRSSLPGAVVDVTVPQEPSRAWRRGTGWREWYPSGHPEAARPTLEDVVIVAALRDEGGGS